MNTSVLLVDYGSGNLRSAARAVDRVSRERDLNIDMRVSDRVDDVAQCDHLILPGVGAFGDCAHGIQAHDGLWNAIETHAHIKSKPFLGICVGMQLMLSEGLEHGTHKGFGWIGGKVTSLSDQGVAKGLKIPHMGWNTLTLSSTGRAHPVLRHINDGDHAYFVHSFAADLEAQDTLLGSTDYGGAVTSIIGQGTMIGTQFHPEKSQRLGLDLIGNFLEWRP